MRTTSTTIRYVAIVDLFSVLRMLSFSIESLTSSRVLLNRVADYTGAYVQGLWLAFPCDNFALVEWSCLLADDFEGGVRGTLLKSVSTSSTSVDNFVFATSQGRFSDIVGSVRSVVPGLVSSSASVVLTSKVDLSSSASASMSDGSSRYALGTFAKVTGDQSNASTENSVIVFGLSVA